ncbi:MAG: 50S ribosomal protein L23, partial [Pseudomonadota bacterium]
VAKKASKIAIKNAIENIFDVTVIKVNVLNAKPKQKMFKGQVGHRQGFKKAYVSLKQGDSINLFGNE